MQNMGPTSIYKKGTPEGYKEFEWIENDTYTVPEEKKKRIKISNLKEGKALSKIAEHSNLTNYEETNKWQYKKPEPEAGEIVKFNPLYEL